MAGTLYDKLWDAHVVAIDDDGQTLLYIDRQLLHEVSSPQAFAGLSAAGLAPHRPATQLAVADRVMLQRQMAQQYPILHRAAPSTARRRRRLFGQRPQRGRRGEQLALVNLQAFYRGHGSAFNDLGIHG